jgi:hypothetical protein
MRQGQVRIERQRQIDLGLGKVDVSFEQRGQACDTMRQRLVRVLLDRLLRALLCQLQRVVGVVAPAVLVIEYVRKGEARIGLRIIGVERQRLPQKPYRLLERGAVLFLAEHDLAAAQKTVISIDVGRLAFGKARLFRRAERHLERVDDPMSDIVLNLENIGQIAIVAVAPEMSATFRIDELRGNAHALAGPAD